MYAWVRDGNVVPRFGHTLCRTCWYNKLRVPWVLSLQCSCWKPRSRYLIPLFPDSLVFCRYHPRSPLFRMHQPQIGIIYSSTTRDRHFEIWRCEINWFWTPRSEINTNSLHHHQIGTNFLHRHHITTSPLYRSKIGINGVLRYEIGINRVLHHKIWQK